MIQAGVGIAGVPEAPEPLEPAVAAVAVTPADVDALATGDELAAALEAAEAPALGTPLPPEHPASVATASSAPQPRTVADLPTNLPENRFVRPG